MEAVDNTVAAEPVQTHQSNEMKICITFLAVIGMVLADHHEGHINHDGHDYVVKSHDDLLKYRDHCTSQLQIPADLVEKYKTWQYPDDEKTHCYMKCVFEQFGFFNERDGFDVKKIHHQLMGADGSVDHNDETHTKIERCADKNTEGSSACDWAYRGGMCFIRENLNLVKRSVQT